MNKGSERSILILAPHPFFSERGTPIAVRDLAAILSEGGWKVTILTLPFGEDLDIEEVEVIRTRKLPFVKKVGIGLNPAKLVADLFLWFSLVRLLSKRRFTVYHPVEESVFLAWLASIFFKARIVYDMDSCMGDQIVEKFPMLTRLRGTFRFAEKFIMRRVDWILPVCPALGDICEELAPRTPRTILHDIAPPRLPEPPSDLIDLRQRVGEGYLIGLYVGNFESYQGVDLIVEAMERLDADLPLKIVLVGGGDRVEELKNRVETGAANGRVIFGGPKPFSHLPHILEQADILLSPRCKGVNTPMKLYAYLGAGRSILATRILSHTQILAEEDACWVAPEGKAVAEGLEKLVEDPEWRSQLAARACHLSQESFSREVLKEKILGCYERLETGILADGGEAEN